MLARPNTTAYRVGKGQWRLTTNSRSLETAFGLCFPPTVLRDFGGSDVEIGVEVSTARTSPPWAPPLFRGRDHLVFCRFGEHDCAVVDLLARRIAGRFSRRFVTDLEYWQRAVLPAFLGLLCPAIGVTPIHAACLKHPKGGLLISAESGAGKSTLAVALAQAGFGFVSDDWTYVSRGEGDPIEAWSPPVAAKLLPDADTFFPELKSEIPVVWMNGELAYEVDPKRIFAARSARHAVPRWIVLYERTAQPGFEMTRIPAADARAQLERTLEELPACLAEQRQEQRATLERLTEAECWQLCAGGPPQEIAQQLARFCDAGQSHAAIHPMAIAPRPVWPDMLRRRVPAPYSVDVQLGAAAVRLEFQTELLLRTVTAMLPGAHLPCRWKLSFLETQEAESSATNLLRAIEGELAFMSFGESGFVAADGRTATAFGEIDRRLLASEADLKHFFAQTGQILARCGKEPAIEPAACLFDPPLPAV